MPTQTEELLQIARRYCDLIDSLDGGNRNLLAELNALLAELNGLLPRLHAAIAAIRPVQGDHGAGPDTDLDRRFELYTRLHRVLGDLDGYWMEFDVAPDRQEMSGSLADDLTDIYFELKDGLARIERQHDAGRTLGSWRDGFCKHWGQHVVDAERHLYALTARDRLY